METLFWLSVGGVLYPYIGYPLILWIMARLWRRTDQPFEVREGCPSVTLIIAVHNEEKRILKKVINTKALRYPEDKLEVLFVSDGSTDRTVELIKPHVSQQYHLIELPVRGGKAAALNAGLERAKHDIVVFSDASIELEPDALLHLVRGFSNPNIGCISGEDKIPESGGEAWYGRYELFLRRLESSVHSIVGASGSFYAQRRTLCTPFEEGLAPDFASVLKTVEHGFRAISEPTAVGLMTSVKDSKQEFQRKVRTLIRGMTALFVHKQLLNPFKFGVFAVELWSHKILRWLVPFFLIAALVSSLAMLESPWFVVVSAIQIAFYGAALLALVGVKSVRQSLVGKVALYFSVVNAAIVVAWFKYLSGVRQELWTPTQR
ncbi:MAG: glycosyltransferase family 2 protein [Nitrospira sp.]|nr:glycosyltransferase family 2 protein [Nitrospira sp.]